VAGIEAVVVDAVVVWIGRAVIGVVDAVVVWIGRAVVGVVDVVVVAVWIVAVVWRVFSVKEVVKGEVVVKNGN
jgi:hypothetical protein